MKDHKPSFLRSLLQATTLAIGFGTIWAALAAWLGTAIEGAWRGPGGAASVWEQLVVRADGTPLISVTPR